MDNVKFYWREVFRREKLLGICSLSLVVLNTAMPLLNARLPKIVLQGLEEQWKIAAFLVRIFLVLLLVIVGNALSEAMIGYEHTEKGPLEDEYYMRLMRKSLHVNYETLESQTFQEQSKAVMDSIYRNHSEIKEAPIIWRELLTACLGLAAYGILLLQQSILLLLAVLLPTLIAYQLQEKARKVDSTYRGLAENSNRKMKYIDAQSKDSRAGKDIRLYHLTDWLLSLLRSERKKSEGYANRCENAYLKVDLINIVLCFFRDVLAYLFLITQIVHGQMAVSDFVWFMAIIGTCQQSCYKLLEQMERMGKLNRDLTKMRNLLEAADDDYFTGTQKEKKEGPLSITFDHVSYRYPGSDKDTLKDISFTVSPGEKIGLVGLNGAGKTTLIKLLCGLYRPTKGTITVDGKQICEYEKNSYYDLLSVVFQHTQLLPLTIAENVSGTKIKSADMNKVREALDLAGLGGMIQSLDQREQTSLAKGVIKEAIELSGGNQQKLWIARAIYKNAPLLLLDEPTAALDPLAEQQIYEKYAKMSKGKTSIFISHRLSSTRFCDRIFYLENGTILEEGTHEQLLRNHKGYEKLFSVQSQYYKQGLAKEA